MKETGGHARQRCPGYTLRAFALQEKSRQSQQHEPVDDEVKQNHCRVDGVMKTRVSFVPSKKNSPAIGDSAKLIVRQALKRVFPSVIAGQLVLIDVQFQGEP